MVGQRRHDGADALVIDAILGGPDGIGLLRVPNGAAGGLGPFLPPASALVEEANDLVQGSFKVDGDLLVLTATQGVLRFDIDTRAAKSPMRNCSENISTNPGRSA